MEVSLITILGLKSLPRSTSLRVRSSSDHLIVDTDHNYHGQNQVLRLVNGIARNKVKSRFKLFCVQQLRQTHMLHRVLGFALQTTHRSPTVLLSIHTHTQGEELPTLDANPRTPIAVWERLNRSVRNFCKHDGECLCCRRQLLVRASLHRVYQHSHVLLLLVFENWSRLPKVENLLMCREGRLVRLY